jgi:hypothetical protein
MSEQQYILEIEWVTPELPRLVGPFDTRTEAEEWAALNIGNGSWGVAALAYPYLGSNR